MEEKFLELTKHISEDDMKNIIIPQIAKKFAKKHYDERKQQLDIFNQIVDDDIKFGNNMSDMFVDMLILNMGTRVQEDIAKTYKEFANNIRNMRSLYEKLAETLQTKSFLSS